MDSTPGAGPSRPRQGVPAPSAMAPPPATPRTRRRSWFPFGSSTTTAPDPSANSMPPPPLPPTKSKSKSKSKPKAGEEGEEVELGFVRPRQSMDMARTPSSTHKEEEELLTIDGQVDKEAKDMTVRKKKKRRSKGEEDEGETMRMTDFNPARRTSTASDASSRTEMPSGNQRTFSDRKFTRTASDRAAYPDINSEGFIKPPPRVSSIPFHPPAKIVRIPSDTSNKEQPPIPVDRPLPPLPPEQASTPPTAPTGIVVTPSSPRKDRHDRSYEQDRTSLGTASDTMRLDRRSRSSDSKTTRSRERTVRSSPIGLGLPKQLVPTDDDLPPPLPSKKQSVSTPIPTRTPSPIPKIAFIEPDEVLGERGRTETVTDKRTRVKRARSLSGIFKSSPVVTSVTPTSSRPTTPDPKEADDGAGGGGILEWLGMKKTVKRRQSETHLRHKHDSTTPPQPEVPRVPSPVPRLSHDSRSGRSPHGSFVDLVSRHSQDSANRPPSRSSAVAPSAGTSPSKLGSLFSRRQASKRGDSSGGPSPPTSLPSKVPGAQRDSGAASARSSFSLPPFDPAVSPIYPNSGPWMSSPGTEMEEMLFSPEGGSNWGPGIRPWMDGTDQPQRSARSSVSSPPLGSLPERSVLEPKPSPAKPVTEGGRGRSHSDAPPPSAIKIQDPHSTNRHHSPDSLGPRMAMSLQSSPAAPGRPKLGNRANSGNAAIIDRMKTVFARNSSRQRASTLLPEHTVHIDEFGSLRTSHEWASNASSASFNSPRAPDDGSRVSIDENAQGSLLGLQDAERRKLFQDNGSNRSSIAASITSQGTSASARPTPSQEMRKEGSFISRARPRASTMSSGPTNQAFAPPSPIIFPAAATPPRRRPSAIRKLSNTLLGASSRPSSPKSSGLFPLPPRSSGSVTSVLSTSGLPGESDMLGPAMSPRPSMGSIGATTTPTQNYKHIAKREGDETSEQYVERISALIPRNEIAGALATSGDTFHAEALKGYMTRFDFKNLPLDVALRQLLMRMSLPKETQQIDRVMEAFAARYEECEPDLFQQKDNTYVLAFSMMMLHTDAFNKHNKNKMTKSDYVRNTRLDGVSPLVLEAFFDNITFTPFVFIEDDADLLPSSAADTTTPSTGVSTPGSMPPPKSSKIDVYHMIVNHQLGSLPVDVERYIPRENPFSAFGTISEIDFDALHQTFTRAQLLQVTMPGRRKTSTGILSSTPTRGAPPVEVTLKIVKVGTLSRVEDTHDTAKKASRKWKTWSVVLTGTQLLFLKDSLWATMLQERAKRLASDNRGAEVDQHQPILLPPTSTFKPDEVFPLKECVAVYDRSASQSTMTFRLVMPQHRQYLFSASDQTEMNEWVSLINYAAAFKTAGVRMRGVAMNKDQAVLAGAAAAASHKREVQGAAISLTGTLAKPTAVSSSGTEVTTPKKAIFGDSSARSQVDVSPVTPKSDSLKVDTASKGSIDVDAADDAVVDEGEQLEEVFDVVKAELAAGRGGATRKSTVRPYSDGSDGVPVSQTAQSGRATAFLTQIKRYTTRRQLVSGQLESYLTTARNLAILTPFQRSTRDRIASALPALADRIKADRIQLVKYDTWISILRQDLDKDKQEWARVRHVALQAAAKSLKDPKGVKAVVDDVNDDPSTTLPRLSLPDSTESGSSSSPPVSPLDGLGVGSSGNGSPGEFPVVIRRPSDDHSPRDGPTRRSRDRDRERERTARPRLQRSSSSLLSAQEGETETSPTSPTTGRSTPLMFNLSETEDHDGDGGGGRAKAAAREVGEQAEDWQKTRAAKRVSLASVELPDGEMRRLSLKKRDREVTARYIGENGGGDGDDAVA